MSNPFVALNAKGLFCLKIFLGRICSCRTRCSAHMLGTWVVQVVSSQLYCPLKSPQWAQMPACRPRSSCSPNSTLTGHFIYWSGGNHDKHVLSAATHRLLCAGPETRHLLVTSDDAEQFLIHIFILEGAFYSLRERILTLFQWRFVWFLFISGGVLL